MSSCRLEDEETVEVPEFLCEHLRCAICMYIGIDWKLLPCSHMYCKECVNDLLRSGSCGATSCPECRQQFTQVCLRPAADRNKLAAKLPVVCSPIGRENGCQWKGDLDMRAGHVASCDHQPVACPHEGCPQQPLRKDVEIHSRDCGFRVVTCCYEGCSAEFLKRQKTKKAAHEKKCDKKPMVCNLCKKETIKENMPQHKASECLEADVTCADECRKDIVKQTHESPCVKRVLEAASVFAGTCVWEGKRRRLSEHREQCTPYEACKKMLPLRDELVALQLNIEELRGQATYYVWWDTATFDPKAYKRDESEMSTPFYLRGRKWRIVLYPAGDSRVNTNDYSVFIGLLDIQPGEELYVEFVIRSGSVEKTLDKTYVSGPTNTWGFQKFAPVPEKFKSIEVELKYMQIMNV